MTTRNHLVYNGAVGEQPNEHETAVIDEVAEREQNLRAGVEQEIQATIDYADDQELDGRLFGQTLVEEELMQAREWEIERTRVRWDRDPESDREARSRTTAASVSLDRRTEFQRRAASVDVWADPGRGDAREQLTGAELGAVNREAVRIADELGGFSSAAVSRLIARRVVDGLDFSSAVVATVDELRTAPGQVVPIGLVEAVDRRDVDIEGTVMTLWQPSHPSISQVGLIGDESGRVKFTAWRKSRQPVVCEGQQVRFRNVARNWYRGRVSVALTGWSQVEIRAE